MFPRAYNIRLYPSRQQEVLLCKTFGCCRKIYNCMLEARQKSYDATNYVSRIDDNTAKDFNLVSETTGTKYYLQINGSEV
jgi:putative transposase